MQRTPIADFLAALRLWRVWYRLGIQDLRLRFRRSVLGASWILVHLVVTIVAVGTVYGSLLGQDLRTFLPFLTAGLVVWGFLTSSIVEGSQAFVASEGYIKQIGLPIHVYVLRTFVSVSVSTAISLIAYVVVALVYGVHIGWGMLWGIPGVLVLAAAALCLMEIFACLNVRFRDAAHLATAALQVLFFVTPVIWPPEALRGRPLAWVIDVNPVYHLLEIVRYPLLSSQPAAGAHYAVAALLTLVLAAVAAAMVTAYTRRVVYLL